MQCSTTSRSRQPEVEPTPRTELDKLEDLFQYLPSSVDLEATARRSGALIRRREVKSAVDLLRIILGYSVCDWSLRLLGVCCELWGLGHLSKVALRKRLQHSVRWLGMLIVAILRARRLRLPNHAGVRLRIQDASVITEPGSTGTDWRLHLSLNLGDACMDGVELTDAHGGETLVRFPVQPGEIRLADIGYAHASGMGPLLEAGGELVVRINWQNLPLETEDGARFDLVGWLRELDRTPAGAQEQIVRLSTPQGRFALRLIVCPLPPEKVEAARRRARKASQKKKHNVDARTLLAAGFVLLLTNLPASRWSTREVLDLYRIRWQVEMLIKRLKSLLVLDGLRAKDRLLAQAYLLGKVLGALLLEEMSGQVSACAPADWDDPTRPISPWGIMALCLEALKCLVRKTITLAKIVEALPRLRRFLADEPRKRRSRWATARALLNALSSC